MSKQVPYRTNVNLSVGSSVTIKGTAANIFSEEPQLQVDFHTGPAPRSDIAFQFRVYFGSYVVMNSRQDGVWGEEIRCLKMPFEESKPFTLRFVVLDNEYQVMVNDQHCYSFPHRLQPSYVRMVEVWRDVLLSSVDLC